MTGCAPYDPRLHHYLKNRRHAFPHNAHHQKRPKFVKKTACSEPLMARQPCTGKNAPVGHSISVSAVT